MIKALAFVFCLFSGTLMAQEVASTSKELTKLEKMVVALRQPLDGKKLHFRASGELVGEPDPGTFLNSALIYVQSVKQSDQEVRVKGLRCLVLYDIRRRTLTNAIMDNRHVEVVVDISGPTINDALSALSSVFITRDLEQKMKNYFVPNFPREADWTTAVNDHSNPIGTLAGSPVYRPKKDEVFPATILKDTYTSNRYPAGSTGKDVLYLIVDENGDAALLGVYQSDGVQFDLFALDSISRWKFKPGTTKDRPVAVIQRVDWIFTRR